MAKPAPHPAHFTTKRRVRIYLSDLQKIAENSSPDITIEIADKNLHYDDLDELVQRIDGIVLPLTISFRHKQSFASYSGVSLTVEKDGTRVYTSEEPSRETSEVSRQVRKLVEQQPLSQLMLSSYWFSIMMAGYFIFWSIQFLGLPEVLRRIAIAFSVSTILLSYFLLYYGLTAKPVEYARPNNRAFFQDNWTSLAVTIIGGLVVWLVDLLWKS
ncbi:MAG: hypothetical protein ABL898_19310 [Hyphomicrobiaceae bacterium]